MTMKATKPTDQRRSEWMRRVRRSGTPAEQVVADCLRAMRVGYRRNVRSLPGSPDFANKRWRWAIFVNGCFWHHHTGCKRATVPKANGEFWIDKFARNRRRDAHAARELRRMGFKVAILWECETRDSSELRRSVEGIVGTRGSAD